MYKKVLRVGFTLIELLIVVVIIGILATMAVQHYNTEKEKAYVTSMKADMRNLITAQETYFSQYMTYAPSTTTPNLNWTYSPGVDVVINAADDSSWSANGTHLSTSATCAILWGPTQVGLVTCQ